MTRTNVQTKNTQPKSTKVVKTLTPPQSPPPPPPPSPSPLPPPRPQKQRKTLMSQYNLKLYIQQLLKKMNKDVGISGEAKHLINELARSFIQRVMCVTNELRTVDGKATLTCNHVTTAIKSVLQNEQLHQKVDDVVQKYVDVLAEMKQSTEPKKRQPLGQRLGLVFSVSRIQNIALLYKTQSKKSPKAFVALTCAVEEFVYLLLERVIENLEKHKTINSRDIVLVVSTEFSSLFGRDVLGGGSTMTDFAYTRDKKKISVDKRPYEYVKTASSDAEDDKSSEQDVLKSMSRVAFRKLCFRAGMTRIDSECIPESKRVLFEMVNTLLRATVNVVVGSQRKTVYWYDLRTALISLGLPLLHNVMSKKTTISSSFTKCSQAPQTKKDTETARKDRTRPIRNVKFYQKNSNCLFIPNATFKKLVHCVIANNELRLSRDFLMQLQLYVETMLVRVLEHAADITLAAKRDTVSNEFINLSYKNFRKLVMT